MTGLAERGARFRALHAEGIFVMPCAWDAGSARVFASAGFSAIGTTSGGVNWSSGRRDYVYSVARDEMLDSYAAIVSAVDLPVSGDLENGYGTEPEAVAETVRQSIMRGMVGGSIEDQSSDPGPVLIPIALAVERVAAAREAADACGIDYTITARAESFFGGVDDPFADATDRANRYVEAGADCIFIPGPSDLESISAIVDAVDAPISVGIGSGGGSLNLTELAEIGVRRVSTGGALPRALYAVMQRASEEMLGGTFGFSASAVPEDQINSLMSD